jgi:bacterioferritin-associated ferredoxin
MYICICNAVTDSQIRNAIDDGATSIADLNASLSVGSCCGKCTRTARELLKSHISDKEVDMLAYSAI